MSVTDRFSRIATRVLPQRLARLYGRSLYGALLLVVFGGLAIPAGVGGWFLVRALAATGAIDALPAGREAARDHVS